MKILFVISIFIILSITIRSSSSMYIFPPGILTDNYGIVTNEDIEINANIAYPTDEDGETNLVWFCINVDAIESDCEDMDYNEDLGENGYSDTLQVLSDGEFFEFQTPRAHGYDICSGYQKTWKELAPVGDIACFSAYYVNEESADECDYSKCSNWIIDKVKSKKGKWSYFMEEES